MAGLTDVQRPRVPTDGHGGGTRTVQRRRGLPGGRAVVGAFLVTAAAVGLFATFTTASAGPRTRYVVAARDVPVGTQLTAADLALVALDLPAEQRGRAFDDIGVLEGATVIGPLSADDLVQSSDVVAVAPTQGEQVSFPIPVERAVGGRLLAGERIDLLATFGGGTEAFTTAVVRDAQVLDVDRGDTGLAGGGAQILTIGVPSAADSLRVVHATTAGEVTVVRTTALDRPDPLPSEFRPPDPALPAAAPRAPAGSG